MVSHRYVLSDEAGHEYALKKLKHHWRKVNPSAASTAA
jgi:hypothetical protein